MYNSPSLRRYQYYIFPDWAGGVYASPSMAGSRPGSILAGAWAVMNHVGQESVSSPVPCSRIPSPVGVGARQIDARKFKLILHCRGYEASCRQIVSAARHFASQLQLRFSEDLYVLGDPKVSVVAFASRDPARLNIYAVGDGMSKRGWHLNALSGPAALHMAFTVS